jgi:hypothetical protein
MSAVVLLCALAALAGSVLWLATGDPAPVAAFHLAYAAAVLPLILTAMREFAPVLTRTRPANSALRLLPWLALLAGWLAVAALAGILPFTPTLASAAGLALVTALAMLGWLTGRARAALGGPHPCLHWYLAALALLLIALAAVLLVTTAWPQHYEAARRLHLHLNTVGFVALTAVGTLQVLMPTVTGTPDAQAAARLRTDLPLAGVGALSISLGAVSSRWLALAGAALWGIVLTRLALAWWREQRAAIVAWHGAAPSLAAALLGLALLLVDGLLHATGFKAARGSSGLFLCGVLLPLVTGAASHLLPLWMRPAHRDWQLRVQRALQRLGGLRALAFLGAGVLAWRGSALGYALAFAALLLLPVQLLFARAQR